MSEIKSGLSDLNKNSKLVFGKKGEDFVANFLIQKKFKILKKNFACRLGEVDIIAEQNDLLVFVEVKTRKKSYFPISIVVTKSKQRKIIMTAKLFLIQNKIVDRVCRFDVATLILTDTSYELDYIEDAFREFCY